MAKSASGSQFDAIVVGTGGVGSAALYHLAKRGARVLGLDRFEPGHDRGSSHGQTRIIRQAYFEHADYVPLLKRAYVLWDELSGQVERRLFHQVGLIEAGPADGIVVPGVLKAAQEHGLEIEELSTHEARQRFDGLLIDEQHAAVFEPQAGYLRVEDCVAAHIDAATRMGAELRTDVEVRRWSIEGAGVRVETADGDWSADRLVITAGPWANDLLGDLGVPLEVVRKSMFWYVADDRRYDELAGFPTFFYELPDGMFYGFPKINSLGVKVAEHTGGQPVDDPLLVDRSIRPEDEQSVRGFLQRYLPGVSDRRSEHAVCMYTKTADEHFIVDRHPGFPQVVFSAGLSGHGFKFTSVLGEVMAELALDGKASQPVEFLSASRGALRS